jgi:hypothetical protein
MHFVFRMINPLTPELNPSAQRCLPRFFTGILIFKGLIERRRSALKGSFDCLYETAQPLLSSLTAV